MTKAFILTLDTGSDTDFITLSSEISDALVKEGMHVIEVKPWSSPVAKTTLPVLPIPPDQPV